MTYASLATDPQRGVMPENNIHSRFGMKIREIFIDLNGVFYEQKLQQKNDNVMILIPTCIQILHHTLRSLITESLKLTRKYEADINVTY